MAMLDLGSVDHTRCAAAAGYSAGPEGSSALRVTAHRLAHDEKIQAAIQEEARRRMKAGSIMAASVLLNIAGNPAHKDQLKAATQLLDRSGLHALSEHKVTVENTPADEKAMVARITELAKKLDIDPKKLLGERGIVVDAEYEIVESGDGLEDLL